MARAGFKLVPLIAIMAFHAFTVSSALAGWRYSGDENGIVTAQTSSGTEPDSSVENRKSDLAVNPNATSLDIRASQLPQSVHATIKDIAAMCDDAFLSEGRSKEAILAEDIDHDGTYDFLLDHVQFCPGAINIVCGASRCPLTLIVSNDGHWKQFDFVLQGYKEFSAEGFLFACSTRSRKAGVFIENGKLIKRNCP